MSDNKQLKEQLRERAEFLDPKRPTSLRFPEEASLHREAADTIERLEAGFREQKRHADAAFKEAERYRQLHLIDAKRADQAEAKLATLEAQRDDLYENTVSKDEARKGAEGWKNLYLEEKEKAERDAAVLEALTSDGVVAIATQRSRGPEPSRTARIRETIKTALQYAQEQVGESDD